MKQSYLRSNSILVVLMLAPLVGLFIAFAPANLAFAGGTKPAKKKQNRTAYRGELDRLLQENKVPCKVSLDCEALPLGAKACGGPAEYIVLSKATRLKMQDAFTDLTKTILEMDQTANAGDDGMVSTCNILEAPEVICKAGTCAAK